MFKNAKVGEKVYSKEYGEGFIAQVCTKTITYPVIVQFNGIIHISFTYDGKEWKNDSNQSLFYTIKKEEVTPQVLYDSNNKKYMVFLENGKAPKIIHTNYDLAETEAKRLSSINVGKEVSILEVLKAFKSKVVLVVESIHKG